MKKAFESADLFCGAGGTSTGILKASEDLGVQVNLLAVNHWPTAINSHSLNHPEVRHKCESLDTIRPIEVCPSGRLHLLAASPECQGHSIAAGGMTRNDQSRATAWHVCRWAADLTIDNIMIENVKEFMDWGPLLTEDIVYKGKKYLKDRPDPRKKGQTFKAFIATLQGMGYNVEWRIQCAADFGDPTTRKRLIILARRDGKPIKWPEPTHGPGRKHPYRTARECIDWNLKGQSIFGRKRPLSKNTLRRIAAGLKKYGGKNAQPFLVKLYGTSNSASVDEPMPTVTAGGNHLALAEAEPFLVGFHGADRGGKSVDEPMRAILTKDKMALVEPFVMHTNHAGGDRVHDLDKPLPTVTAAHRGEMALVEPFIVGCTHGQREDNHRSVNQPLPTVTTAKGGEFMLCEPFIAQFNGQSKCHPVDQPLNTVTTKERFMLCEPFVLGQQSGGSPRTVDNPLPTVTTDGAIALVEPFIVQYNQGDERRAKSVDEPLPTITTEKRFGLVEPFIVGVGGPQGAAKPKSVDDPMNTVLTENHAALVEPFIVSAGGPNVEAIPVSKPMNTVLTRDHMALVEPFVAKYYGTGVTAPVSEPLDTVTTKDRFLLVEPDKGKSTEVEYDIRIRMLQPHELQAAMSFPKDYQFSGTKADQTKQIGNAVPVELARAHAKALLSDMV